MNQREALKLALEALEWNLPVVEDWGGEGALNLQHKAINAIREALAQPEPVIDKSAAIRIARSLGWEPKRKPLTEKEIDQITEQLDETTIGWSTHEFARAIEAAHGIQENK